MMCCTHRAHHVETSPRLGPKAVSRSVLAAPEAACEQGPRVLSLAISRTLPLGCRPGASLSAGMLRSLPHTYIYVYIYVYIGSGRIKARGTKRFNKNAGRYLGQRQAKAGPQAKISRPAFCPAFLSP